METLDWIVIGLFCLALVGIIVWVMRQKQDDSKDYFLGGRDATWIAIGASIFASNIGSEHLIGLAGAGASSGMAMAHWEIQGWMILLLGWVFVPFYSRSMVYTMPEFLERRYNPQSRTILSLISLISYVLTKVAVTVYAGGLVFQQVFGIDTLWGIDFFWIAAIGLVVITARCTCRFFDYRFLVLVYRPVYRAACPLGKEPKRGAARNDIRRVSQIAAGFPFPYSGHDRFCLAPKIAGCRR